MAATTVEMTLVQFMEDAWRDLAGAIPLPPPRKHTLAELQKSEWSDEFEALMRARLLQGAFRYGLFAEPQKRPTDRIASMRKRIDRYEQTGNLEALVDVANFALTEFVRSGHPKKHFHTVQR